MSPADLINSEKEMQDLAGGANAIRMEIILTTHDKLVESEVGRSRSLMRCVGRWKTLGSRSRRLLSLNTVAFHLAPQGRAADAESAGDQGALALVLLEHGSDGALLGGLQGPR